MPCSTGAAFPVQVTVDGLKGGHSGVNIHECRGNANQLLTRSLRALLGTVEGARVASMQGGDKRCGSRRIRDPLLYCVLYLNLWEQPCLTCYVEG